MPKLRAPFLFVLLALAVAASGSAPRAQEWTPERFEKEYAETYEIDAALALCRTAVAGSEDPEFVRAVQSYWMELDAEDARDYFKLRMEDSPETAAAIYLYGRTLADPLEKLRLGRRVIELEPDWPLGYRLVLTTYDRFLFSADGETEALAEELERDAPLFERFAAMPNAGEDGLRYLASYQMYAQDYEATLATLDRAREAGARWVGQNLYAGVYAQMGQYEKSRQEMEAYIDAYVVAGRLPPEERDTYVNYAYQSALREAGAYEALLEELQQATGTSAEEALNNSYNAACLLAVLGREAEAMEQLQQAVAGGYANVDHLNADEDLAPLRGSAEWDPLLQQAAASWEADAVARREKALAAKIERESPDWSLSRPEGAPLALAELRGQVLVLDFWATWCNPCRQAMPVLDTWIEGEMPEGVRVFSINVWERKPAYAQAYMLQNEFDMELLFGDEDLAKAYGISGIPYICVVDKQGRIRYEETGFTPDLAENLSIWVGDLLDDEG